MIKAKGLSGRPLESFGRMLFWAGRVSACGLTKGLSGQSNAGRTVACAHLETFGSDKKDRGVFMWLRLWKPSGGITRDGNRLLVRIEE